MRGIRRIVASLIALSTAYIWTVGQSGLKNTNQNLCDLINSLSPWELTGCEVQLWIIYVWSLLGAAACLYLLFVSYLAIKRRFANRRDALPATLVKTLRATGDETPPAPTIAWGITSEIDARRAEKAFSLVTGLDGYWIKGFRFQGLNQSGEQLTSVAAYVTPHNTGNRIVLRFEVAPDDWLDTSKSLGVPPGCEFHLVARVYGSHREEKLASIDEYLQTYGGFTLRFSCAELPALEVRCPYSEIKAMLLENSQEHARTNTPPPRVRSVE